MFRNYHQARWYTFHLTNLHGVNTVHYPGYVIIYKTRETLPICLVPLAKMTAHQTLPTCLVPLAKWQHIKHYQPALYPWQNDSTSNTTNLPYTLGKNDSTSNTTNLPCTLGKNDSTSNTTNLPFTLGKNDSTSNTTNLPCTLSKNDNTPNTINLPCTLGKNDSRSNTVGGYLKQYHHMHYCTTQITKSSKRKTTT